MSNLTSEQLADLFKSGLSEETIARLGISSVRPQDIRRLPNVRSAYRLPYHHLDGTLTRFERWKLFPPVKDVAGHSQKYYQPPGTHPHLYLPPLIDWIAIAADPSIPIYLVEGEKKCACACQLALPTIGIGGVWNWRVRLDNGERITIPTLDLFVWKNRRVEVIPDSDAWLADKMLGVLSGFYALSMELIRRGSQVELVKLL